MSAEDAARVAAWPNALPARRSPCRIDATLGLRQHRCSSAHAEAVRTYRDWRDAAHAAAETADAGTVHSPRNESGTYWQAHARPTFRDYLTMTRRAD